MAGGKIDILVEPDLKGFSAKLEGGLRGTMGKLGAMGAAMGAAFGGAFAVKDIAQAGLEMDRAANNLRAVTQATDAEMSELVGHAKELGKATDLTATSTSDALTAMLELSKGGFSIQESMDAAKGSLQLASAAQIEVGQAAGMTTQLIQAFGLQASDAARVSDVLAGAANAAAGEIPDMALGMSQAGTVANMFGVSMEETVTALSMFANKGVQGSDAGTMLKTMLTQLANPSKEASRAMEELGLSAFDAQGNFVGLPGLFDQLREARSRLSQEDFNEKAGKVFGTDAIRAAAIAAESGAEEWDDLYNKITRTGQAAEMAEAQTAGLPGVAERLENTTTALKEEVYEKFSPLLVDLGNSAVDALEDVEPKIGDIAEKAAGFMSGLSDVFGTLKVVGGDVVGVLGSVGSALGPITEKVGVLAKTDGKGSFLTSPAAAIAVGALATQFLRMSPAVQGAKVKMKTFNDEVAKQRTVAKEAGEKVSYMAAAWGEVERRSPAWQRASQAFRDGAPPAKKWADNARLAAAESQGFVSVMHAGSGKIASFSDGLTGVARAGGSLVKTGFGGLIGALGGPWGLAIMGATTLLGHFYQKHLETKQAMEESKDRVKALTETYDELSGAITEATDSTILQNLEQQGAMEGARKLGISTQEMLDAVKNGTQSQVYDDIVANSRGAAKAAIQSNKEIAASFEDAGVSISEYVDAMFDGNAELQKKLETQLRGAEGIGPTNEKAFFESIENTLGAYRDLNDGIIVGAKETAEAHKNALTSALTETEQRVENTKKVFEAIGERAYSINDTKISIDVSDELKEAPEKVEELEAALERAGAKVNRVGGKVEFDFSEVTDGLELLKTVAGVTKDPIQQELIVHADSLEEAQREVEQFGLKVRELPDGRFAIDLEDEETKQKLVALNAAKDIDGTFTLANNADETRQELNALDGTQTNGKHEISNNAGDTSRDIDNRLNGKKTFGQHIIEVWEWVKGKVTGGGGKKNADGSFNRAAVGAYRTAASGHLSAQDAMMAAGGDWIVWAEDETDGESFIPHAMSKRVRSTEILLKTANLFGLDLVDKDGNRVASRGISTAASPAKRFANGGLASYTEGREFNVGQQSFLVSDLIDVTKDHIQAVGTIANAEKDLADMREQFAREVEDVKEAEERLEQARKNRVEQDKSIGEAEKNLAKSRKNLAKAQKELAEKSRDGKSKEEDLEAARERVADAADSVAKAEEGVVKAREGKADSVKEVKKAEKELAEARKTVSTQTERAAKAQQKYIGGYITAAGEAVQRVLEIGSNIANYVADKFTAVSDFFSAMGEVAESVARLKQTVVELNMEQVRLRMAQMTAAADLQDAEINVARTRAQGISSVADAEAELERVQRRKYAAEFNSVEAMFAAQVRYYDTGLFSWQMIQDAMAAATAEERAAIANVALAKANAALNDLSAQRDAELAAYDYQTAVLNNKAAVSELSIYTDALRQQSELLAGMSVNQAHAAAAAFDGEAQIARGRATRMGGFGKTLGGGAAGAAAGFALGGPLGAMIGALGGLTVGGMSSASDFRQAKADIKIGQHKVATNRDEANRYLNSLSPSERQRYLNDAQYVGGANVRTTLEAMQRRTDDQLQAHKNATDAIKLQREQQRVSMESQYRADARVLQSDVDYYTAQKKIAESETAKQVAAYAEVARIAAETRDQAIRMQSDMRVQNAEVLSEIKQLVGYAEQEARRAGVKTHNVEFTLPPGESFTREQTLAMMNQLVAATDVRLTELENRGAPKGADYFVR